MRVLACLLFVACTAPPVKSGICQVTSVSYDRGSTHKSYQCKYAGYYWNCPNRETCYREAPLPPEASK